MVGGWREKAVGACVLEGWWVIAATGLGRLNQSEWLRCLLKTAGSIGSAKLFVIALVMNGCPCYSLWLSLGKAL